MRACFPICLLWLSLNLGLHAEGAAAAKSGTAASKTQKPATAPASKPAPEKTPPNNADPEDEAEDIRDGPDTAGQQRVAAVSSIAPEELANFEHNAPQIQQLIRNALDLTKLNLTYTFGSSNPSQGGMDCSGTIVHLLQGLGIKGAPRQSDQICAWVRDHTLLHRIEKADSLTHPEFSALQPGDLLFWTGTYAAAPRDVPVTHVMLYLGKLKKNGKHVVFGASDGRVYQGQRRTGVSVFDFTLPKAAGKSAFYGYGLIPGIGKAKVKPLDPITIAASTVEQAVPKPKNTLDAKDGIQPLKKDLASAPSEAPLPTSTPQTSSADGREEIRPAAPAVASSAPVTSAPASKPAAAKKKTNSSAATKSKSGTAKSKRSGTKR